MTKVTDSLTKLISGVTQMERDITTLNEQLLSLEKEKEKGYKSFNTETHVLVEREALSNILEEVNSLRSNADYTLEEIETSERCISDARYNADDVRDSARNLASDIEALLLIEANKGDNNG